MLVRPFFCLHAPVATWFGNGPSFFGRIPVLGFEHNARVLCNAAVYRRVKDDTIFFVALW